MILEVQHETCLEYSEPVSEWLTELRMEPLSDDQQDNASFLLIEYPVGCWYCEMPEPTGIVLVELAAGKTRETTRGKLRITGKLFLNAKDPEDFLYTIKDAQAVQTDE